MTVAEVRSEGSSLVFTPRRGVDLSDTLSAIRSRVGQQGIRRQGSALVGATRNLLWLQEDAVAEMFGLKLDAGARRAIAVRADAAAKHDSYREFVAEVAAGGTEVARDALLRQPTGLDFDRLDDHQIVNVAAMTAPNGYGMLLFDEQGAGKTVSVIYAFDRLVSLNLFDTMIVVAPKSMVGEWKHSISEFMGDRYTVAIVDGTGSERIKQVDSGADVVVLNYEAIPTVRDVLVRRLRRHPDRCLLVVDESFAVKNPDARRTRQLESIRDWFGRTWLLCGTPAPNTAHDIVSQVSIVDFGQTFADVRIPQDRAEAAPIVREALNARAIYLRNLKSDVLPDLPSKSFTRIRVPLAPHQSRMYHSAVDDLAAEVASLNEAQFRRRLGSYLARRMTLLRIASNPVGIVSDYDELPGKLKALDDLVDRCVVQDDQKLVIWSSFTASLSAIVERYSVHGAVRYDGSVTSIAARRDAVQRFQNDPATRVFVANPAAAGAGLTLHAARYAVYESFTNQAAQYLQSLDRIHRRGQTQAVEYFVLLAEGSIEPAEFDSLVEKEHQARDLLGDVVDAPVTRETFLRDLLTDGAAPAAESQT